MSKTPAALRLWHNRFTQVGRHPMVVESLGEQAEAGRVAAFIHAARRSSSEGREPSEMPRDAPHPTTR